MHKAKVLSEKYQLRYKVEGKKRWEEITEDVEYKDTYWRAFSVAGAIKRRVEIVRLTQVKLPDNLDTFEKMFYGDGETAFIETGLEVIDEKHFAVDKLSRYHPVNGWVIPEEIALD